MELGSLAQYLELLIKVRKLRLPASLPEFHAEHKAWFETCSGEWCLAHACGAVLPPTEAGLWEALVFPHHQGKCCSACRAVAPARSLQGVLMASRADLSTRRYIKVMQTMKGLLDRLRSARPSSLALQCDTPGEHLASPHWRLWQR